RRRRGCGPVESVAFRGREGHAQQGFSALAPSWKTVWRTVARWGERRPGRTIVENGALLHTRFGSCVDISTAAAQLTRDGLDVGPEGGVGLHVRLDLADRV